MRVRDLLHKLRDVDPDAMVMFLPLGADEDELENVNAFATFGPHWTRERGVDKGRPYEFIYAGEPNRELRQQCDNVVYDALAVVVLSVDDEFLRSRHFPW
ncbi:hypothetical protein SBC2_08760 [Caballeronia sp. SBC2]|nr:hypothetical protein SBC2_08760 [Caballeronia sp. SBC2]